MRAKIQTWWQWIKYRPYAMINMIGLFIIIVGGGSYIIYQSVKPLDVLQGWTISISGATEYREVNGKRYAVYNPGESLVFSSQSTKLIDVKGQTSRMIVCEATDRFKEREIQLDTLLAARPAGDNPRRENAIVVPDLNQFEGLPRFCRLVINIVYENVALGRSHIEHAETETFIVEEPVLNPSEIRNQIQELNNRIKELEARLLAYENEGTFSAVITPQPVSQPNSATAPPANTNVPRPQSPQPQEPSDDRSALGRLPVIGGLLDRLGL